MFAKTITASVTNEKVEFSGLAFRLPMNSANVTGLVQRYGEPLMDPRLSVVGVLFAQV